MPNVLAVLFAFAAGSLENYVFRPPANRGLGSFLVVLDLGLLALVHRDKDPSRSRLILIVFAVLAPVLHALVQRVDVGEAYLRALREVPLGILAFFAVRALDRRIERARPGVAV